MSGKRLLIIGVIITLLATIPLTVYFLQKQQDVQSHAAPATRLYFNPPSASKNVGDTFSMDVMMDPGSNQVSFVKLTISYDQNKINTVTSGTTCGTAFCVDASKFPATIEGPIYNPGNVSVTLSVGANPTNVIQAVTKIGTITFQAKDTTGSTPSQITFGSQTQVLSIASSDQPSENVLSGSTPGSVTIGGGVSPTPSPTTAPAATATPAVVSQVPVCSSLTLSQTASSSAVVPFSTSLTAVGNVTSPKTISKVTFNFGDGTAPQDVTQTGGIGTSSVTVQTTHIYNTAGSFTASALLTDSTGAVSTQGNCSKVIAVGGSNIGGAAPVASPTATLTPAPTLKPGPGGTILGVGTLGAILSIVGGLLFFSL